ncbi:FG-GAP repeat domain-containing protein [Streptomyces sp. NPDC087270]|uniref:FG-GAP repeat domain-containing protein n=1 Tax=Streptomyces sp. NPDC087270 TaxID=3365774 RepID=UPI003819D5FA
MGRSRAAFTVAVAGTAAALLSLLGCTGRPHSAASPTATTAKTPATSPAKPPAKGPGVPEDFTGDGRPDLVVAAANATIDGVASAGYLAVVPGSATGADPAHATVFTQNGIGQGPAGTGGEFGAVTVSADLDGDGRADLIAQAGRSTVFVVWGGATASAPAARLQGRAPLTGDFDGDGHPDLLLADDGPAGGTIDYGPFSRTGKPARTAAVSFTPQLPKRPPSYPNLGIPLAVGDFNGDGRDDVVTQWLEDDGDDVPPKATVIYYGSASGLVRGPRLTGPDGKDVHSTYGSLTTYTADLNGDGHADVVDCVLPETQGDTGGVPPRSRVTVNYGGPHGIPARAPQAFDVSTRGLPEAGTGPDAELGRAAAVGDINADRYADLAFTTTPGGSGESGQSGGSGQAQPAVVVLYGGPNGLTVSHAQTIPGHATALRIIDLDHDGHGDLVIGQPASTVVEQVVRVLRGSARGVRTAHPQTITADDIGRPASQSNTFGYGFAR